MISEEYKKRFDLGCELMEEDKIEEAISVLSNLRYTEEAEASYKFQLVYAGCFSNLRRYKEALPHFTRAAQIDPSNEMASLGIYVSLVHLEKYAEAISELERYLDNYSADLYRDTLEELLGDIKEGYATNYKEVIYRLAKKNDISI